MHTFDVRHEGRAMLAQELLEIRFALRRRGIIFAYSGYVTESVLTGLGEALKQKLTIEDASTKTTRSVFAVFVEQMQNIIRYSAERLPPDAEDEASALRYGLLTIAQENGDHIVYTGNLVQRADVERMRLYLAEINGLDKRELKTRYREQLRLGPGTLPRSAGIGFIEIARRVSKPLEYDFIDVDDQTAFFALKASI
jgi:hypothetical protein